MSELALLARNEEINKWLGENPLILGLLFLVIGTVVGGWGIYEMMTGVSHDKFGRASTGGYAKFLAGIRIVAGVGCICFALYKMAFG